MDLGKKSDTKEVKMLVVAGALRRSDGFWLMHKRPEGKNHAGLWEFPGGKVEPSEIPAEALVRELKEELGIRIRPADCRPVAFAESRARSEPNPIVILLYSISVWAGDPSALEGGEIRWFSNRDMMMLDMPPLDVELAKQAIVRV